MHHVMSIEGPMLCSWVTDESDNQYSFGDTMEHGLYYSTNLDDRSGLFQDKPYFLTVRNGCSCTWLSQEDAQTMLDRQKPISGNCDIDLKTLDIHSLG